MKSTVLRNESAASLRDSLAKMLETGARPTLAFCFAGDSLLNEEVPRAFADHGIPVFGASSREEIADGRLSANTITTLLLDVPEGQHAIRRFEIGSRTSTILGTEIARWALEKFSRPALLISVGGAGFRVDSEAVLAGIFAEEPMLPVFGGLASRKSFSGDADVFDASGIFSAGIVAVAFDNDEVDLRGVAISGWLEIGTPKTMNRSQGNVVYEINGSPARDIYKKYFRTETGPGADMFALMEYPLQVTLPDGSKVMRVPIAIDDENGSVTFAGAMPQGGLVRFCSPNIVETIKHTIQEIEDFRDERAHGGADAVLLFDCAIRSNSFGIYMKKEVELIRQLWGAPLAGFSSWGEIGPRRNESCALHNTTLSIVVLKSRNSPNMPSEERVSERAIETLLEPAPEEADVADLRQELAELRKQKVMLSNFLALNSDDLDAANREIAVEKSKSESLLLNVLPEVIAQRLKSGEKTIADQFDHVSILFADLVGFTDLSSKRSAKEIVSILSRLFVNFDALCVKYGAEKIKTIGDAYMAVTGLPKPDTSHAVRVIKLGRAMLRVMELFNDKYGTSLRLRVGVNSGSVIAGVIGSHKFSYDLWGDTVNIASRMESHGEPGRVHISSATYELVKNHFSFESRGEIQVKGKGSMATYFLAESDMRRSNGG